MLRRSMILVTMLLICFFSVSAEQFTIVIDAGHGGKDVGAVDNQVKEKRAQTKATEPDKYEEQYELTESERYEIGENVKEFIKKNRYDSVEKIKEKN